MLFTGEAGNPRRPVGRAEIRVGPVKRSNGITGNQVDPGRGYILLIL